MLGWKEFELEVMRDRADNVVIICSIENFDPMGVHTGDSITVAPAQTLTDKEYQVMRDAAIAIIREIGVDTGGSNIQFARRTPRTARMVVIEMNPRVSRSSALASKATGFPIAKIAAKLAVGYTLDEIQNDITRETPASFEPTIDYVVTKIPRFTFEKFPSADDVLDHADEVGRRGDGDRPHVQGELPEGAALARDRRTRASSRPTLPDGATAHEALWRADRHAAPGPAVGDRRGVPARRRRWRRCYRRSAIDPWFLRNLEEIVRAESALLAAAPEPSARRGCGPRSSCGFSDRAARATLWGTTRGRGARAAPRATACSPVYKRVDTCARRVRGAHAVLLLDLRGRVRGAPDRARGRS